MDRDISKKSSNGKGSERANGRSTGGEYQPLLLGPESEILALHSAIGNQAVGRLLQSDGAKPGMIQAKLTVSRPGDKYEQEADRVADMVMRMPELYIRQQVEPKEEEEMVQTKPLASQITPLIRRQVEPAEEGDEEEIQMKPLLSAGAIQGQPIEEEEEELQAKEAQGRTPVVAPQIQGRIKSLRNSGQPLPPAARAFFEPRFGVDFSAVRIHNDSQSAETARSINARAFTLGRDIVIGGNDPNTDEGRRLLAHELTHVIQQRGRHDVIQCDAIDEGLTFRTRPIIALLVVGQFEDITVKNLLRLDNNELLYVKKTVDDLRAISRNEGRNKQLRHFLFTKWSVAVERKLSNQARLERIAKRQRKLRAEKRRRIRGEAPARSYRELVAQVKFARDRATGNPPEYAAAAKALEQVKGWIDSVSAQEKLHEHFPRPILRDRVEGAIHKADSSIRELLRRARLEEPAGGHWDAGLESLNMASPFLRTLAGETTEGDKERLSRGP
jgi:Domain of unknown function (DUF4157)